MIEQEHFAEVEMFGRELTCKVIAVGKPMDKYPRNRTLWIERAEDEYAKPYYVPPFCLLYRDDWLKARKLFEASAATAESRNET